MDVSDFLFLLGIVMFLLFVVCVPLALVNGVIACVVYSRTKKWDQQRREQAEVERLVEESEDDFLDTDDEADHATQKAEEAAELNMTFWQKFKTNYRREINGTNSRRLAKKKEREEKKKMAKAVARQVDRLQRRRNQDLEQGAAGSSAAEDIDLPSYFKATELEVKKETV